ncbi:MAG TPA: isoprenylcysteine carboxylmethyltransferase family protein [Candidatus Eisenbacteria bacterium]|nr:isoprenylcysteine carboxylmethyltransferase family protein [Candidatus Eisenbacteria bacterium]
MPAHRWLRPSTLPEGSIDSRTVIFALWFLWGIYWAVAAIGRRRVARRQPVLERLGHLAVMGIGFALLYAADRRWAGLNRRFLPDSAIVQWIAVLLTILGLGLAVFARVYLGRNWSAEVVIREDHHLIRSGPYAHIRHPIYTGLLLAVLGAVLAIGEIRAIVGFVILLFAFTIKALREEEFLAQEFGEEFERHRRHTGLFLPRLTRARS